MSDKELKERIEKAMGDVNALLDQASDACIEFTLQVVEVTTFKDSVKRMRIGIDGFHKKQWL